MGKCWSKNTKWQLCKMSTTRESIYSMMTVINNIVLNTGNFLRQYISDAHIKNKKMVTVRRYVNIIVVIIIFIFIYEHAD